MVSTNSAVSRLCLTTALLSFGMALPAFFPTQALAQPGFVITSPPAGSVFYPGQAVTIAWTGGDPTWNVDLSLADVGLNAAVAQPAVNIPNSGTVNWTFPSNLTCGRAYEFYVQNVQRTSWAYGPHFVIACPSPGFVITSPSAGSVFYPGQPVVVVWTGGDPTWNVDVSLVDVELNAVVAQPAVNIPNRGTLNWTFPSSVTCGHTFAFYVQNVQVTSWAYGPHFSIVCQIPVGINIKPGSCPNKINPKSEGVIRVAILSGSTFDATTIDQNSLTFGRTGNEQSLAFCEPKSQDVNGDGAPGLVCRFNTPQTAFQSGDTVGILRGKTVSGMSIIGMDYVHVVAK